MTNFQESVALSYYIALYCSTHTRAHARTHARTRTHTFNGAFSGTTQVCRYQKGKTNLDFTEAGDSEWQWHQLGQVCTLLQTDNHTSTPPLSFYRPDAFPAAQPTASKHWRQVDTYMYNVYIHTYIQIYIEPKIVKTNLLSSILDWQQFFQTLCWVWLK